MPPYQPETYGDRVAEVYDEWFTNADESMLRLLGKYAGKGRALELGIGTGRVAIPLKEQGVDISGIDASPAMVNRLRMKPNGEHIPVVLGDFADIPSHGEFSLIFSVFNTFFGLLDQEDQIRCFRNVAAHLTCAGVFVIEAFVPDMTRFDGNQLVRAGDSRPNQARLEVAQLDKVHQRIEGQQIVIAESGIRIYPFQLRYAWPSELDIMARLAGLRIQNRWSTWEQAPFTGASTTHISVYSREGSDYKEHTSPNEGRV